MSVILVPDYVVIGNDPDYSDRVDILGTCIADSFSALPDPDFFDGFLLANGFRGITSEDGKEYILDSGGSWHAVVKSYFEDVYTKSEIDTMLQAYYTKTEIDALLAPITDAVRREGLYIYQLILYSDLNLCSVRSGTSTGYFVQDLPITLPPGTYIWKMQRDGSTQTSMRVKAADDTSLYNVTRGVGVNDITQEFTITDTGTKLSIYTGSGINVWDNMIFKKIE